MKKSKLRDDTAAVKAIKAFVDSPVFLVIKDAFISGEDTGEKKSEASGTPDPILLAYGKHLGILKTFDDLREIAEYVKPPPEEKKPKPGVDPDLAT